MKLRRYQVTVEATMDAPARATNFAVDFKPRLHVFGFEARSLAADINRMFMRAAAEDRKLGLPPCWPYLTARWGRR